ncbi:MAG: hypothetical protein LC802_08660 [Acidobacteria bacterium]|nr:hypothetical protein [Acidobacteriota bacterium]
MNDFEDHFDDLIDDETETETESTGYFASGEEDDEDGDEEPFDIQTAVLSKNGMLALLTLKTGESGGQIVRFDPRQPLPTAQRYDDEAEAARWFRRSLATSLKNGWTVVYDGEPLFG